MKTQLTILLLFITTLTFSQVTDYDGNVYDTIRIGNQTWFKENLRATHYADGTPVDSFVYYNHDTTYGNIYGYLYNYPTTTLSTTPLLASVQGICPNGWRVPSSADWSELNNFVGSQFAGVKLKDTTSVWANPNYADNSSGFSAVPGGAYSNGTFFQFGVLGAYANFWATTNFGATGTGVEDWYLINSGTGWYDGTKLYNSPVNQSDLDNYYHFCRCIKDTTLVGIDNKSNENTIKIHPNPTSDWVVVEGKKIQSLSILNLQGQLLKRISNNRISVKSISSGIYYIEISLSDNIIIRKKIIIER